MGIHQLEQRLRNLGKIVVDLQMNPRGEEREAFEQPLDMRIFALGGLE